MTTEAMNVFTRDDGRPLRILPGFRERVLGYRAPVTPKPQWDPAQYASAAEKKRRRFKRMLAGIARWRPGGLAGAEVLDVGCGGGINCLLAALEPVRRVCGIDLQPLLLDEEPSSRPARQLAEAVVRQRTRGGSGEMGLADALRRLPLRMAEMDARRMSFADGSFDVVLSRSAMEHLMPIEQALAEMARVTRRGGLVHHGIDPYYWLRGCHKRGVVDIPWAHARLTVNEYERFVAGHEGPAKAADRRRRLETLNALTLEGWKQAIESGPFEVLAWEPEISDFAATVLAENPDVAETLLPGITPADLVCGRIDVWLWRT